MLTGKGLSYGGSLARTQATGYGLLYLTDEMLRCNGKSLEGKTVVVSGAGNVATYAIEKAWQLGAKPVTCSDSTGWIYDPDGIDVATLIDVKQVRRARLTEYAKARPNSVYHEGKGVWTVKCDVALPCATQNELLLDDAKTLVANGCFAVAEGANMPTSLDATAYLQEHGILFCPGKASNAGGVATGEQAGTLLGYLMDTGGLSQGDINASFYLYGKTLVAVRCDGRAGENRAALRLDLGLDAAQGDVSIAVEKLENGEKSAFSYKIGARGADGAHTETAAFGTQSISCDWQPKTGDMVLTLPGKSPISLNLSQAQDGFQIQTKDFAALIGINSQKGFDSTMTVRKGSAITTPKYKNLDEWSLDDLLVLLGSIGGLLGFK